MSIKATVAFISPMVATAVSIPHTVSLLLKSIAVVSTAFMLPLTAIFDDFHLFLAWTLGSPIESAITVLKASDFFHGQVITIV